MNQAYDRVRQKQPPVQMLVISDPGEDLDDEMAAIMLCYLEDIELVQVLGVVCNLRPSFDRARLMRGTLDLLGMHHVPVAVGTDGGSAKHHDTFSDSSRTYIPGVQSERAYTLQSGRRLMHDKYTSAAPKSISLLLISSIKDAALFLRDNEELFVAKTLCVTIMGGVQMPADAKHERQQQQQQQQQQSTAATNKATPKAPKEESPKTDGSPLERRLSVGAKGGGAFLGQPQWLKADSAHNNQFDAKAANFFYLRCQQLGVPLIVVSRFAAYATPIRRNTYDELALMGGAIGWRLRNVQRMTITDLWRRACAPEGDGRRGLPMRCDKKWFANTFCGGEGEDRDGDEPIWDLIKTFNMYDSVALLAAVPLLRERFFKPSYTLKGPGPAPAGTDGGGVTPQQRTSFSSSATTNPLTVASNTNNNSSSATGKMGRGEADPGLQQKAAPVEHLIFGLDKDDTGVAEPHEMKDFLQAGYRQGIATHHHGKTHIILVVEFPYASFTSAGMLSLMHLRSLLKMDSVNVCGLVVCAGQNLVNAFTAKGAKEHFKKMDTMHDPEDQSFIKRVEEEEKAKKRAAAEAAVRATAAVAAEDGTGEREVGDDDDDDGDDDDDDDWDDVPPIWERLGEELLYVMHEIGMERVPMKLDFLRAFRTRDFSDEATAESIYEIFASAPETGVTVCASGGTRKISAFLELHWDMFQRKTRNLIVFGGAAPFAGASEEGKAGTGATAKGGDGEQKEGAQQPEQQQQQQQQQQQHAVESVDEALLRPDLSAPMFSLCPESSELLLQRAQELGVRVIMLSHHAASRCRLPMALVDWIGESCGDFGKLFAKNTHEMLANLLKQSSLPAEHPGRVGIPPSWNTAWFIRTFCDGTSVFGDELDPVGIAQIMLGTGKAEAGGGGRGEAKGSAVEAGGDVNAAAADDDDDDDSKAAAAAAAAARERAQTIKRVVAGIKHVPIMHGMLLQVAAVSEHRRRFLSKPKVHRTRGVEHLVIGTSTDNPGIPAAAEADLNAYLCESIMKGARVNVSTFQQPPPLLLPDGTKLEYSLNDTRDKSDLEILRQETEKAHSWVRGH